MTDATRLARPNHEDRRLASAIERVEDEFERLEERLLALGGGAHALGSALRELCRSYAGLVDDLTYEMRSVALERAEKESEAVAAISAAVDSFLDVVERPVGTFEFRVPDTYEARRVFVGLYDAVGRNL